MSKVEQHADVCLDGKKELSKTTKQLNALYHAAANRRRKRPRAKWHRSDRQAETEQQLVADWFDLIITTWHTQPSSAISREIIASIR